MGCQFIISFVPHSICVRVKNFSQEHKKRDLVRAQTPLIPSGIQFTGLTITFSTKKKISAESRHIVGRDFFKKCTYFKFVIYSWRIQKRMVCQSSRLLMITIQEIWSSSPEHWMSCMTVSVLMHLNVNYSNYNFSNILILNVTSVI